MLAAPMAASASASFARNPDIGGLGRGVETAWASSCGATRRADEKPAQLGFFAVRILSELDLLNCPIWPQNRRSRHSQPGRGTATASPGRGLGPRDRGAAALWRG
jgi:hypothetical protein